MGVGAVVSVQVASWKQTRNVGFHGRVPEALEVKRAHFLESLLSCPSTEGDEIGGENTTPGWSWAAQH